MGDCEEVIFVMGIFLRVNNVCGVAVRIVQDAFLAVAILSCLSATQLHTQAATQVLAWGAGTTVGSPPNEGQSIVPAKLTNAVEVAGGGWHSLALRSDGTLQFWGDHAIGETNFFPPGASNYLAVA